MSPLPTPESANRRRAPSGVEDGPPTLPSSGDECGEVGSQGGAPERETQVRSDHAYWQRIVDRATD